MKLMTKELEKKFEHFSLSELEEIVLPFGLTIERDLHTTGKKYVRNFI